MRKTLVFFLCVFGNLSVILHVLSFEATSSFPAIIKCKLSKRFLGDPIKYYLADLVRERALPLLFAGGEKDHPRLVKKLYAKNA